MSDTDDREAYVQNLFRTVGASDSKVRDLLMVSVGRILLKKVEVGISAASEEHAVLLKMTEHIRDWLAVAVADQESWLSNVDVLGRPKKLMKFSTIEAIVLEADRQMKRKQRCLGKASQLVDGDEEIVFDAGDGWSIVRLLTPASLDRESEAMQHCIGHGAYDTLLQDESVSLLSLRDPAGNPHITLEVRAGNLVQFQGKQNKAPLERYVKRCLPYLNAEKISCFGNVQLVTDVNGVVFCVYDLPEVLESEGDVFLHNDTDYLLRLPRIISAKGFLIISGNAFSNTPDSVVVGGSLQIFGTALASTPASFSVAGSIIFSGVKDVVLPSNLCVQGDLILKGSSLKSLPRNLFVRDNLVLEGTEVDEIPGDLRCGSINISKTAIRRFHAGVFRDDNLDERPLRNLVATDSALEELEGMPHFGSLTVGGSRFTTPDGLVVEGILRICGGTAKITPTIKALGGLLIERCEADVEVEDVINTVTVINSKVRFGKSLRCGGMVILKACEIERTADVIQCETLRLYDIATPSFPAEIIASELVLMSNIGFPRLEGVIKTPTLCVHPSTTFLGEGIEAETVTVIDKSAPWTMDLVGIKGYLAAGGDLHKKPDAATSH